MCIPETVLNNAAQGALETIVGQIGMFVGELVKVVVSGWLRIPSPQVADSPYGPPTGAVARLRGGTNWMVASMAVGSLLYAAARIAVNRNGREAAQVARGIFQLVLLSGLSVPMVLLLTQIGDLYSDWIISRSTNGRFEQRVGALFTLPGSVAASTGVGLIGSIFLGLILAVTMTIQIMLMFGRTLGLVLLTGTLPVAAAVGMVGAATRTRDKAVAWLIAFVVYKPAAATIYAAGFWLIGEGRSLAEVLSGVMTFVMALVALPALMRLIAPAVGNLANGAGSGAVQGALVGAAVATGAATVGGALAGALAGRSGHNTSGGGGSGSDIATGALHAAGGPVGVAANVASKAAQNASRVVRAPADTANSVGRLGAQGAGSEQ